MAENNKYCDLCFTCKHTPSCTFPKKSVSNCEEFEVETCSLARDMGKDKLPAASVDPEDGDSSNFIGLCGNCDDRKTCVFPKPAGGIWFCEGYKIR